MNVQKVTNVNISNSPWVCCNQPKMGDGGMPLQASTSSSTLRAGHSKARTGDCAETGQLRLQLQPYCQWIYQPRLPDKLNSFVILGLLLFGFFLFQYWDTLNISLFLTGPFPTSLIDAHFINIKQ